MKKKTRKPKAIKKTKLVAKQRTSKVSKKFLEQFRLAVAENEKNKKTLQEILEGYVKKEPKPSNMLRHALVTGEANDVSRHIRDLIEQMNKIKPKKRATYGDKSYVVTEFDKKVEAIASNPSLMAELSKKWNTVPTEYETPKIAEPSVELVTETPEPVKETLKEKHYLKQIVYNRLSELQEKAKAIDEEIVEYTLLYKFLNK